MGSPRDDVVFRLWQCDKENHGWREGPPLTVPCQSFNLLAGPSPSRLNQLRTKKRILICAAGRARLNQNIGRFKTTNTSRCTGKRCGLRRDLFANVD
jgi:hypothetical protein